MYRQSDLPSKILSNWHCDWPLSLPPIAGPLFRSHSLKLMVAQEQQCPLNPSKLPSTIVELDMPESGKSQNFAGFDPQMFSLIYYPNCGTRAAWSCCICCRERSMPLSDASTKFCRLIGVNYYSIFVCICRRVWPGRSQLWFLSCIPNLWAALELVSMR